MIRRVSWMSVAVLFLACGGESFESESGTEQLEGDGTEQTDDASGSGSSPGGNMSSGGSSTGTSDGATSGGGSNDGAPSGGSNDGAPSGGSSDGAPSGGSNDGAPSGGSNDGAGNVGAGSDSDQDDAGDTAGIPSEEGEPGASDPSDGDPSDSDPSDSDPGGVETGAPDLEPWEIPDGDGVNSSACEGRSCGDECDVCQPGGCRVGGGVCTADGSCVYPPTECEADEPEQPEEPISSDCECPVPAICQLCGDDATCATPIPHCSADGECLDVSWKCPEDEPVSAECEKANDCSLIAACTTCANGQEWCPQAACVEGKCGTTPNLCPEAYDPCAGKADGDYCQLCSPLDPDCIENTVIKVCGGGICDTDMR